MQFDIAKYKQTVTHNSKTAAGQEKMTKNACKKSLMKDFMSDIMLNAWKMRTVRLLQTLYGANTTSRNKTEWIDYANKIGVEKMVKDGKR